MPLALGSPVGIVRFSLPCLLNLHPPPMISLDSETTGTDFHHGARPYFVTVCHEDGTQRYWEWDVDPLTREVSAPDEDLREITAELINRDVVGQNIRFDVAALSTVSQWVRKYWPWGRTDDTLLAGHLLASNQPHDLTSMAVHYLGVDIQPYEDALEAAVKECRRYCRTHLPDWALASHDRPDMPSCPKSSLNKTPRGEDRDSAWKYDAWLPRALARELGHPDDHPWWTVLSDYSNADSAVTLALWGEMRRHLERRKLWDIYSERRKLLPVVYRMTSGGVTVNRPRLNELIGRYRDESDESAEVCRNVAAGYAHRVPCPRLRLKTHDAKPCPRCDGIGEVDFELELPAGGSNESLHTFCSEVLKLEPVYVEKAKTPKPSLGKEAIAHWQSTLPPRSREMAFVNALARKRLRDTQLSYLAAYVRFWLPRAEDGDDQEEWYVLHPNLNITGTDTLRFSSSNPNSQNIKKGDEGESLRYAFGPPPGYEWWSLDAQNIELRLPAYKSGEPEMIDLFEQPDRPPYYGSNHLLNFATVYPDIWKMELEEVGFDKVGPHCKKKYAASWYQSCKNGGFSKQYGGGRAKVDATFRRKGAYDLMESRFRKLAALNRECIRFAEKHGYVETWPDRTVDPDRGYPLMCTRTERGDVLSTVPLNYKTQGTAMQWTCKGMVRCDEALEQWNREQARKAAAIKRSEYRIVLQVHDEMVFELPCRADPRVDPKRSNLGRVRELARLMALGGDDVGVPTPVGIEYNPVHWAEGFTFKM